LGSPSQFYPLPFPDSRPLLAVCVVTYFILSSILQFMCSFVEKDYIMTTLPRDAKSGSKPINIATDFPRFSEFFHVRIEEADDGTAAYSEQASVGKFFTHDGEFWEVGFEEYVQGVCAQFEKTVIDKKGQ
jgi:signal peptidase complex subunit 2